MTRRDQVLDAAIRVLGEHGVRGLTHRAVDAAAGLPTGSASNLFRTRDALLGAVIERIVDAERGNWETLAATEFPATPADIARVLTAFAQMATGPQRTLTLARYAILVEAGIREELRARVLASGGRANAWFTNWLRIAGSTDPGRDAPIVMNHWTGVVLHQLARPVAGFDPSNQITALVTALLRPQEALVAP
jgi:AcrR family transcriptional regulator